jgi:hypothetical protein
MKIVNVTLTVSKEEEEQQWYDPEVPQKALTTG